MKTASFTFSAESGNLSQILLWVSQQLENLNLFPAIKNKIEVALEEAIVNIFSYAYSPKTGLIEIAYELRENGKLVFTLKDYGIPFNPLEYSSVTTADLPLIDREKGGVGIQLIRSLCDEVRYQRRGNTNILTLEKRITE